MNIVVIGSNGQLGTDLIKSLRERHKTIALKHEDIEVTDYSSCQVLKQHNPDVVINTAALLKPDECEEEPLKTFQVNALGSRNIANICSEIRATAVYISTDYVFDGTKTEPYTEKDIPNPINTYGISKLAGEMYAKQTPAYYIFRVSNLFGSAGLSGKGSNFVEAMIAKATKNEPISVVNDMWMSPTYTKDAAAAMTKIIEQKLPFEIYHVANQGCCTWFEFAKTIFKLLRLKPKLTPTETNQLQCKAKRPKYSAMQNDRLSRYDIIMPKWSKALENYLLEKGHLRRGETH